MSSVSLIRSIRRPVAHGLVLLLCALFLRPAVADEPARGAELAAARCARCHGADGRGISPEYPSLAGQHAEYIVKQIFAFKTGLRISEPMVPVANDLLAVEIRSLSKHYAGTRPGRTPAKDAALLAEGRTLYLEGHAANGVSACVACHGPTAAGGALLPRLAGQNPVYLERQMRDFRGKTRHNDQMMHMSLSAITDREIQAVAAYVGNLE